MAEILFVSSSIFIQDDRFGLVLHYEFADPVATENHELPGRGAAFGSARSEVQ